MSPDHIINIEGCFLRPMVEGDISSYYIDGLNNPLVNFYMDSIKNEIQTYESVRDFVLENKNSNSSMLWGLWKKDSKKHIGTVRLYGINWRHRTAYIGICIFDMDIWGQGIGSNAINAVSRYAVAEHKLRWIEAGIFEANIGSQKAFLGAGYIWNHEVCGKYLHDGRPANINIYVYPS